MSGSHEDGSAPQRELEERHDELAQASIALNTAYDRLQDLRASLRSFTAQRDRLSGARRTQQQTRLQSDESMRPEHSAIVFSESEEESEPDIDVLRESFHSRVLELTTRWRHQHARSNAVARQIGAPDSRQSSSVSSDEHRFVYPPSTRRRRPPPPAAGVIPPPNATSPARRSILEAHMRHLRRASSPSESSTTLGRRVTQRAAAQAVLNERQGAGTRTVNPANTIVRSTLPLGLEPRPPHLPRSFPPAHPHGIESRAATHLRHSLLPNPPSGIRPASARTVTTNNSPMRLPGTPFELHLRPGATPTPPAYQVHDASTMLDYSAVFDPIEDDATRVNTMYRNWFSPLTPGAGSRPSRAQPEPDTDDTIHDSPLPRDARPIDQDGGVRRRRGWARLDPDGDEISTEDEASLERIRTELRLPRTRNWGRNGAAWAAGRGSQVAVLDFMHHNSRDATTGHRDVSEPLDDGLCDDNITPPQDVSHPHHILDGLFHPKDSVYANPLPVHLPDKRTQSQALHYPREVLVTMDPHLAGR